MNSETAVTSESSLLYYPLNEDYSNVFEGEDARAVEDLITVLSNTANFRQLKYVTDEMNEHHCYELFRENVVDQCVDEPADFEVYILENQIEDSSAETEVYGVVGEDCSICFDGLISGIELVEVEKIAVFVSMV